MKAALNRVRYAPAAEPWRDGLFRLAYGALPDAWVMGPLFRVLRPDLVADASEIELVDRDGLRFRCRATDFLECYLLRHRAWEAHVRARMQRWLAPGALFVDVGAHIGTESVFASRLVGPRGRVLAVEPAPWSRVRLETHLALNGCTNVEVLPLAIGAAAGTARLARVRGNEGMSRLAAHAGAEELVEVEVATLDELWRARGRPAVALIKIDVEGHEAAVLAGARELLLTRPVLLLELTRPAEDAPWPLLEPLRRAGYALDHWDGHAWSPLPDRPAGLQLDLCAEPR